MDERGDSTRADVKRASRLTPALQKPFWNVLSRSVAAAAGGYLLASLVPVALVMFWHIPRVDAVLIAMQVSFVVYVGAVMWAFAARSARLAWIGLGVPALAASAVIWALQ